MKRKREFQVLVVGAGPVGMVTALKLGLAGIPTRIIDKETDPTTRSGACAIHPHSMQIFSELGMVQAILDAGHRIDVMAFYDGADRKAELNLANLRLEFPFAVALPQSVLERLLEAELKRIKVPIEWNHWLTKVDFSGKKPKGTIAKMAMNSTGIIMAETDYFVDSETEIEPEFIIATEGIRSNIRDALQIELESYGPRELFTHCDFQIECDAGHEARFQLENDGTGAFWPLPNRMARWSIQTFPNMVSLDFVEKERSPFVVEKSAQDIARFADRMRHTAPWFEYPISEIDWLIEVPFEPRLAVRFGENRCWLAGDCAHQVSPIGMQGMNAGFIEAVQLSDQIEAILRNGAPLTSLNTYSQVSHSRIESLLCKSESPAGVDWMKNRWSRIVCCLPALGSDLDLFTRQLRIENAPALAFK